MDNGGSVSNGQDGSKSLDDGSILTVGTNEMGESNTGAPKASTGRTVLLGVTTGTIVNWNAKVGMNGSKVGAKGQATTNVDEAGAAAAAAAAAAEEAAALAAVAAASADHEMATEAAKEAAAAATVVADTAAAKAAAAVATEANAMAVGGAAAVVAAGAGVGAAALVADASEAAAAATAAKAAADKTAEARAEAVAAAAVAANLSSDGGNDADMGGTSTESIKHVSFGDSPLTKSTLKFMDFEVQAEQSSQLASNTALNSRKRNIEVVAEQLETPVWKLSEFTTKHKLVHTIKHNTLKQIKPFQTVEDIELKLESPKFQFLWSM